LRCEEARSDEGTHELNGDRLFGLDVGACN
jgi:hypothetical protein